MSHCDGKSLGANHGKLRLWLISAAIVLVSVAAAGLIRNAWETPAAHADSPIKRSARAPTRRRRSEARWCR